MAETLGDQRIRQLTLAFAGFATAEYGVWVAVLVFAYQHGGASTASGVAVAQLLPAGLLAPILARAADREGPAVALRRGYWWQCVALAATATLLVAGAPAALVYVGAIVAAIAVTTARPAQAAFVPMLLGTGERLMAFNVVSGWVSSVSLLAGPAIAGLMIALGGTAAAIAIFAVVLAASAWLAGAAVRDGHPRATTLAPPDVPARPGGIREAMGGCPCLVGLVAVVGVEYLVIGMIDVVIVVLSLDVLAIGAAGAGYLNAALGAGAVVGSLLAMSLIGRRGLVTPLLASVFAWAMSVAVLGAWPTAGGSVRAAGDGRHRSQPARRLLADGHAARGAVHRARPRLRDRRSVYDHRPRDRLDPSSRYSSRSAERRSSCSRPEHCSARQGSPRRSDCEASSTGPFHPRPGDAGSRR